MKDLQAIRAVISQQDSQLQSYQPTECEQAYKLTKICYKLDTTYLVSASFARFRSFGAPYNNKATIRPADKPT